MTTNSFQQLYKAVLSLTFVLLFNYSMTAQDASIYINDAVVETTENVILDVQIEGFDDIVSTSFTLNWDTMALRYVGLSNIALGLSEENDFGTMNLEGGKITYLYFDNSLSGNSLADNDVLFSLELEAVGAPVQETGVTFSGIPTPIEMVDTGVVALDLSVIDATVTIIDAVSVTDIFRTKGMVVNEIYPNPFSEQAKASFELNKPLDLTWTLTTIDGKEIMNHFDRYSVGEHTITINRSDLIETGHYLLTFDVDGDKLTKRLIFIE